MSSTSIYKNYGSVGSNKLSKQGQLQLVVGGAEEEVEVLISVLKPIIQDQLKLIWAGKK